KLDESKTVQQIVEEAVQDTVDLLKEFENINARFAEPMDGDAMNALIERQGKVQEKLDHADAWDLDARLEMAMDALRCPPPDAIVSTLSGGEKRRVALCRLLLQKPLERELQWIRMSPKGPHAKGKARINDYEAMVATESEKHADDLEIYIPPGPRLGDVVIEAHGVSKAYGDTVLFEKLEFSLP